MTTEHGTVQHGPSGARLEHKATIDDDRPVEHTGHAHHDSSGEPENWGQHHEFGRVARISGWVVVVILLLNVLVTHYNKAGFVALVGTAALLVVALLWDAARRKNSWRS